MIKVYLLKGEKTFSALFLKIQKKCQLWPSVGYILQLKSGFKSISGKTPESFHAGLFFRVL